MVGLSSTQRHALLAAPAVDGAVPLRGAEIDRRVQDLFVPGAAATADDAPASWEDKLEIFEGKLGAGAR